MRSALTALSIPAVLGLMTASAMVADDAEAIPAFARKHRMSCTTCHAPYPRLKAFGDDYAGNAFQLPEEDGPPPGYYVETGDPNLSLLREFPLAARLEGWIRHETATGNESDLSTPYNLKLLSGGGLSKRVAYYFYFYVSEHGEVAGVEDAYLMFNDLLNRDLDVYVGQFQVSDPLFKRELRLTFDDYVIYTVAPGRSDVTLKYDRGVMITYGAPTGTDVIIEVVNGNGLAEAEGDELVFDDDKYKNVMGRVSQTLNENVRIGVFGYYGKEAEETVDDTGLVVAEGTNEIWMIGVDGTFGYGPVELNVQYIERRDDNPLFAGVAPAGEIETQGGLVEATFWPHGDQSKWYAVGLYNYVESDSEELSTRNTIAGHVGYVLQTNVRLTVENIYDIENEENSFLAGFVVAF